VTARRTRRPQRENRVDGVGNVANGVTAVDIEHASRRPAAARRFDSASLYSSGHGGNDAQKTMGVIAVSSCQMAGGLGTLVGGWRIVHTMRSKIARLTPLQGCFVSASRRSADVARDEDVDKYSNVPGDIFIAWIVTKPMAGLVI
jgi:phosphate/sulfate permease